MEFTPPPANHDAHLNRFADRGTSYGSLMDLGGRMRIMASEWHSFKRPVFIISEETCNKGIKGRWQRRRKRLQAGRGRQDSKQQGGCANNIDPPLWAHVCPVLYEQSVIPYQYILYIHVLVLPLSLSSPQRISGACPCISTCDADWLRYGVHDTCTSIHARSRELVAAADAHVWSTLGSLHSDVMATNIKKGREEERCCCY